MKQHCLCYDQVDQIWGKVKALKSVSFAVEEGEILGLIGPDGAGKTTLMRLAMGIVPPSRGEVLLLGGSPTLMRCHVGYVAQQFSLYSNMTVMENVLLFGALYGCDVNEIRASSEKILKRIGLWAFKERRAGALSGGMKQKLALASGLVHNPRIILLDEPTTGVDPVARREFWEILYELNREGMTLIVSTPYMDEAELCRRVVFLHQGKILREGTTESLLATFPNVILEVDTANRDLRSFLRNSEGVLEANLFGECYHVEIGQKEKTTAMDFLREILFKYGFGEVPIRILQPSLEDLFVSYIREGDSERGLRG